MREFLDLYVDLVGDELAGMIFAIWIVMFCFMAVLLILNYIFNGISLYTIAKRRGLKACGLAWVPYGSIWVAGSIADHFDRETRGKDRHYRLWLLIGNIAVTAFLIVGLVVMIASFSDFMLNVTASELVEMGVYSDLFTSLLVMYLSMIPLAVLSVFAYIAQYKIYKSCSPKASVWLLLLAIFINFGGLESSIPLFCLRTKDDGFAAEDPEKAAAEQKRLELYN
ncbi:MAG: hypothetical protein IKK29_04240 [Christensenellaceae bacterium]|nr:hypothetical protein [Christensenellaceae bacterium]